MADFRRFVITRDIPGIDAASDEDLKQASKTSNAALEQLNGDVQWESSFIVADKTYCIYKAKVKEGCAASPGVQDVCWSVSACAVAVTLSCHASPS